ncbi:MAG: GNAT family N-acetyltransferase [Bacillota bacterium]|nr:GNAT family N-acetyltransferase [Bacillota bacterium]
MSNNPEIKVVQNRSDRRCFIELPWMIYQNDPNWIPPLLFDMHNTMNPAKNALLRLGPSRFFLALQDGKPVGRLGVGIDCRLNEAKKENLSYFTLFESIDSYPVAETLFDAGVSWLREQGADLVTGPQSPSNGDDYRGLLIEGFDKPPVLLNSYNPPYFVRLIEKYGFAKQFDRYAYYYDIDGEPQERLKRGVEIVQKRYGFKVRKLDLKNLDREMVVIKDVIDLSMPDWPDMIPPSDEEIEAEAIKLKQFAIPDLVLFIENSEGECLGFSVTLPDYNEVLARLNGRLFPIGFIKYLWYKRKIKGVRMFVLFVTPQGRRRGVSAALYYHTMQNARKLGFRYGEGSTIHEFNKRMNLDASKAGGELYKKYRIYQLKL